MPETAEKEKLPEKPAEPPLGITVLIEDLHAVFVMARISMQPRAKPLNPAYPYRESFKRVRRALQDVGRLPV